MNPWFESPEATIFHGDCLDVLASLPDNSVDSVVTDPPYGLANTNSARVNETISRWVSGDRTYIPSGKGFMGQDWDAFVPPVAVWDECFRVLKPGGHAFVFAGSRTFDLMTLALRLAGFDVRDSIAWLYGSGMPKSRDIGRDLADDPAWEGWGTSLKPAFEPIAVAKKPHLGSVASNVQLHGTGALNIGASRIGEHERQASFGSFEAVHGGQFGAPGTAVARRGGERTTKTYVGRFPANVVLDESQAAVLDRQAGNRPSGMMREGTRRKSRGGSVYGQDTRTITSSATYGDDGGASRFFYTSKASTDERPVVAGVAHPTVKPLDLMQWLVTLGTPNGGTVLDPLTGSGTTVEAAVSRNFRAVGIEREAKYLPLIESRISKPIQQSLELFERSA